MGALLGSLVGGLFSGGRQKEQRQLSAPATSQSRLSQSTSTAGAQDKAKAAARLSLVKSGTGGVLDEAKTGRKKLLGN